ncbi:MAG: SDR family NAD(P)-dependent oxidoreductase [Rhodococcus sp.]|nr:SDR family NAD(P)-dependent oxidoreductase [Rhodococcus sp. (in: high G+C Gram-positive bacteria)]
MTDAVTRALLDARDTIVELRSQLDRTTQAAGHDDSPIAVIGSGMVLPGDIRSVDELWRVVLEPGAEMIADFPDDRLLEGIDSLADIDTVGRQRCRGGFIGDPYLFDHRAHGIGPAEAVGMDPQQRVFLDVVADALINSGVAAQQLEGSNTGVYVGASTSDYVRLRQLIGGREQVDKFQLLGEQSFLAGRIAFKYGLRGPAEVIDTACSSSLVAVARACDDLARGRTSLAVAGGVNLILSTYGYVMLASAGAISPTGACRAFDGAADGYVRGEGAGAVVLKRLDDALAAGDNVVAVLRGWAVNHDGRASGITVPSRTAQVQVMREALTQSGFTADQVMMIEAHGTGTVLGDPIEVRSIGDVYGKNRSAAPVQVRSSKASFGHLESAAGVAGLLKSIAVLRAGRVPPQALLTQLNPNIDFTSERVCVHDSECAPGAGEIAVGVNSFGASGTNVHLVLTQLLPSEAAQSKAGRPPAGSPAPAPLAVASAATQQQLDASISAISQVIDRAAPDLVESLCRGAAYTRDHSVNLRAARPLTYCDKTRRWELGDVVTGGKDDPVTSIGFLFPGQGAEFAQMGAQLYGTHLAFTAAIDRVDAILGHSPGDRVRDWITSADESALGDTRSVQIAVFAVEYALTETLRYFGITPTVVIGHSVGEFAAAVAASMITLDEALSILVARADAMESQVPPGGMLAVSAGSAAVSQAVESIAGTVISAINSPDDCVISGTDAQLDQVAATLTAAGIGTRRLRSKRAFHSSAVEPVSQVLRARPDGLTVSDTVTMICNVTGRGYRPDDFDGTSYWAEQVRSPVLFAGCVDEAIRLGVDCFIEVGPGRSLTAMATKAQDTLRPDRFLATLRRGISSPDLLGQILATLWTSYAIEDLEPACGSGTARTYELPPPVRAGVRHVPSYFRQQARPGDSIYQLQWLPDARSDAAVSSSDVWAYAVGSASSISSARAVLGQVDAAVVFDDAEVLCDQLRQVSAGDAVRVVLVFAETTSRSDFVTAMGLLRQLRSVFADSAGTIELVAITQGAELVGHEKHAGPWQSALLAALRAFSIEEKAHCIGTIDLEPDAAGPPDLANLCRGPLTSRRVAVREGVVTAASLSKSAGGAAQQFHCNREGVYFITGGTGALGRIFARWLIEHGAGNVVLASRRGMGGTPEQRHELEQLCAWAVERGAAITVLAADLTNVDELDASLTAARELGPLRGIIHAAAAGEEAPIAAMDDNVWATVLSAKTDVAVTLSELTSADELEFFLLMSSIASQWPSAMMGGYGAANAALDGLAAQLRSAGKPAVSVSWGPWNAAGGIGDAELARRLQAVGLRLLDPEVCLKNLGAMLSDPHAIEGTPIVVDADWDRVSAVFSAVQLSGMFSTLVSVNDAVAAGGTDIRDSIENLPDDQALEVVRQAIVGELSQIIDCDAQSISQPGISLSDLGLDSLGVATLSEILTRKCGTPITTEDLFSVDAAEWDTLVYGRIAGATSTVTSTV